MLGRYIAGTLLILGGAMMVAPESSKKSEVVVARANASPAVLATTAPESMAAAVQKVAEAPVAVETTPPADLRNGVEAALVQALALDAAEGATEPETPATDDTVVLASVSEASTEPAVVPATSAPEARYLYVTGTKVNIRSGPSTQYRVVGSVDYGASVELVAFEGQSWARIRFGDTEKTGYMSRKFLVKDLAGG